MLCVDCPPGLQLKMNPPLGKAVPPSMTAVASPSFSPKQLTFVAFTVTSSVSGAVSVSVVVSRQPLASCTTRVWVVAVRKLKLVPDWNGPLFTEYT